MVCSSLIVQFKNVQQNPCKHICLHSALGRLGYSLRDFVSLAAMIVLVLVLTVGSIYFFAQDSMLAFMGYFFLVFGFLKIIRLPKFVKA